MKFGVLLYRGLFGAHLLDGGLEEIISLARTAERLGYDSAWYADEAWWSPDPITYATLMVKGTERIKVGMMGSNPYVRHPLSLALSFHTFGELAGARGIAGVAAGSEARLKKLGLKRTKPLATVRETIEIIRKLSSGEPLEYKGETVSITGVGRTWIRNDLNVHICANGPKMMKLAGEIADGIALAHFPPTYTAWGLGQIKEGLESSGRSLKDFGYEVQPIVFVDKNRDKAFATAKKYLQYLPPPLALGTPGILEKCGFTQEEANAVRKAFREAFASPANELPSNLSDKLVQTFALTGTPEEAIAKVKDYDKSGITTVVTGFLPEQNVAERLGYFKDQVIDRL